jgi:hypothetical protein
VGPNDDLKFQLGQMNFGEVTDPAEIVSPGSMTPAEIVLAGSMTPLKFRMKFLNCFTVS